jgi:cyanophycinase
MNRSSRWIPLLAAAGLVTSASTAPPAAAPDAPRGSLVIVGGGDRSEAMMRRFVELAGGRGARIAVVPNASSEPEETGRELVAELDSLGARAFVYHLDRAAASVEASARRLDSASGIWFSGGDQERVTEALAGTPVMRAMQRRYREGAVVGGTSAGAAIMSDSMITGNQTPPGDTTGYYGDEYPAIARHRVEIVPGLGFLPGSIVDQHFIRRERHNRLMSVVLERPSLLGVGIDESTALEVRPDGRWRVLGESAVVIYDARRARVTDGNRPLLGATGVQVHVLPSGAVFDPRTGGGGL